MELNEIQDGIIERLHKGLAIDREQILAAHPDHAEELMQFLTLVDVIEEPPPEPKPTDLGEFRIVRELGRGGMGVVYEAEQPSLKRRVALKILPPALAADLRLLARFKREAEAAGRLRHPNIVPVFSVGQAAGTPFFAMELVEGRSLATVIKVRRNKVADKLPEPGVAWRRWAVEIAIRIADALAYAHSNEILHRDIKPANIILGPDGSPRLTDFGLALDMRALGLTMAGEHFGTPQYMSPEQIVRRENPVDARSDGYSLAVTLYELLTLRLPYKADSTPELLTAVQRAEVVAPRLVDPAIEPELEKVLLRGLKKDPDERYQTLAECKQALEALLECWPKAAPPPAPPSRKQTIITALFTALALIAVLLFWQLRDSGSPEPVAARALPKQLAMGGIEVGDWNGDGVLDLAGAANYPSGSGRHDAIRVLQGPLRLKNGRVTGRRRIDVRTRDWRIRRVFAVDHDDDGIVDLMADGENGPAVVYGDDRGRFKSSEHLWLSNLPDSRIHKGKLQLQSGGAQEHWIERRVLGIAVAEFGGLGGRDIAIAWKNVDPPRGRNQAAVSVRFNTRHGRYMGAWTLGLFPNAARTSIGLGAGDFDGDGIDDVVVADPDSGHRDPQPGMLILYVNDPAQPKQIGGQAAGSRNFHAKILPQTVAGDRPTRVLAADCNGDGATDLIVANRDASTIRILLRRKRDQRLATLDYENPGLDFTASNVKGVPDFEVHTIPCAGPVAGMHLLDIDGDRKDDLVLLLASTSRVQILGGLGGGRFDEATRRVARLPVARDARLSGFVVADLDGDGKLDAAVDNLGAKPDTGGGVVAISDIASAVAAER